MMFYIDIREKNPFWKKDERTFYVSIEIGKVKVGLGELDEEELEKLYREMKFEVDRMVLYLKKKKEE